MFVVKLFSRLLAFLISIILLSSCSQNNLASALYDNFKIVTQKPQNVSLTQEQINDFPYANLYVRKNDGHRVWAILAYADKKPYSHNQDSYQLKWISNTNELLIAEHGRIVKTLNFIDTIGNLERSYSNSPDPLSLGLLDPLTPKSWKRYVDWQPGNYNHILLASTFTIAQQEEIVINGQSKKTQRVIENVEVPALSLSYQNQFWLDLTTQQVIASIQRPAPLITEVEIQILKPFNPDL